MQKKKILSIVLASLLLIGVKAKAEAEPSINKVQAQEQELFTIDKSDKDLSSPISLARNDNNHLLSLELANSKESLFLETNAQEDYSFDDLIAYPDADFQRPNIYEPRLRGSIIKKGAKMVWGQPVRNSFLTGMWSYHTDASSRKYDNYNNQLAGIQYKGFVASTFENSHYRRTFFLGAGRTVYTKELFIKDLDLELGYKLGLLYGYGDRLPNLVGISPAFLPVIGFSYKYVGLDFMVVPSNKPVFTANVRLNLDKHSKAKNSKYKCAAKYQHQKPKTRSRKNSIQTAKGSPVKKVQPKLHKAKTKIKNQTTDTEVLKAKAEIIN